MSARVESGYILSSWAQVTGRMWLVGERVFALRRYVRAVRGSLNKLPPDQEALPF